MIGGRTATRVEHGMATGSVGWGENAFDDVGSSLVRATADIQERANIQVEVIAQPAVAEKLLAGLEKDFFPRYGMIACESDVRVLRREKF
jgi:hypothetical protein